MDILHEFLNKSCANAAYKVIEQKTLRPPYLFQNTAEHPYGEHIEEQMGKSSMHEHISNQLCCIEVSGKEEMQA